MEKKELRKTMSMLRNEMSSEKRQIEERKVYTDIWKVQHIQEAKDILCYVSFGSEFNTFPIIQECLEKGRNLYAPRVLSDHEMEFFQIHSLDNLIPGKWGILEPSFECMRYSYDFSKSAVMFLPGLAFDLEGYRLGYGKGFYDRYIANLETLPTFHRESFPLYGLAYSEQIIKQVPHDCFDQKLDDIFFAK